MRIHAVPRCLGSLGPRSARLPTGSRVLADLTADVLGIEVEKVAQRSEPSGGGSPPLHDGVAHLDDLLADIAAQRELIAEGSGPLVTLGGDCSVELAAVETVVPDEGPPPLVLWFDAHPDLNAPDESPSGAFHGMVLRVLLGDTVPDLGPRRPIVADRLVLAGVRSVDPGEQAAIERAGVAVIDDPAELAAAVGSIERVYVHIDLDVLDPGVGDIINYPEPGGWSVADLVASLRALRGREIVGAGLMECVAATRAQVEPLTPVIAELGRLLSSGRE